MKDELKYSIEKFNKALLRLNNGIKKAKDQLDNDGVIQRFEFTFELLWKTLRLFLLDEGIITKSPKEALKEAFRFGLIKDEEIFLDMLEDRNQTSHIYSEEISKEIVLRIKKFYLSKLTELSKELLKASEK
ncbi:MAG TPA: HI0074 family nucleotidyltransferase substrate-binding subunit [Ignavibacteriaceae bacterium]|jgi:nucleotidyltransferase substrate binding protein (TIGR01987 family)|nr:HI0074 family nucleotidyltransferase substrate-binding subunit [Ignavibacteriaceae bacterium]